MKVRCTLSASDDLVIRRSGNSLVIMVTELAHALDLEYGDSVRVTLELEAEPEPRRTGDSLDK